MELADTTPVVNRATTKFEKNIIFGYHDSFVLFARSSHSFQKTYKRKEKAFYGEHDGLYIALLILISGFHFNN